MHIEGNTRVLRAKVAASGEISASVSDGVETMRNTPDKALVLLCTSVVALSTALENFARGWHSVRPQASG